MVTETGISKLEPAVLYPLGPERGDRIWGVPSQTFLLLKNAHLNPIASPALSRLRVTWLGEAGMSTSAWKDGPLISLAD